MTEAAYNIVPSEYPLKWYTYSAIRLLHNWCHVKMLLSCHRFCGCHTTMHQLYLFIWSHIHRVHVCLAVTCQLHFQLNDLDLLSATVVKWGSNGYWNKSQYRNLTGEANVPTAPHTFRSLPLSYPCSPIWLNNILFIRGNSIRWNHPEGKGPLK